METLLPLEIDFERSHGAYLVDKNTGDEYLDLFSMYSSLAVGYNHEIFNEKFNNEVLPLTKLRFCTNAMQTSIVNRFHESFSKHVFSSFMHFTCTGALAVESSLKAAMEYKKVKEPVVLSIENSFHGVNGWGLTTSLVGFTAQRLEYMPRLNWPVLSLDLAIDYLENKDLANIVAVIVEPIQCTNGDIHLDKLKLKKLYHLCYLNDVCFILDEIQTGFGTTGKFWYYQYLGFEPDILIFGKKAQVCGIVMSGKYSSILNLSQKKLQVTFDGDLIDMLRSHYILNYIVDNNILNQVLNGESFLKNNLSKLVRNYRSHGYLIAFDLDNQQQRDEFIEKCFKQKLIVNKAGEKTIRLRPNLACTKTELLAAIDIMKGLL